MNDPEIGAQPPKNWIERWKNREKKGKPANARDLPAPVSEGGSAGSQMAAEIFDRVFFVDYENVNREGLTGISQLTERDCVKIYYSRSAETLTFGLHRRILESPARFEYTKVQMPIKNAIDCLILFDISDYFKANPNAGCFIVSHDNDFDKAIEEFRGRGLKIRKIPSLAEGNQPEPKAAKKKPVQKRKPTASEPANAPQPPAPPAPSAAVKPQPKPKVSAVAVRAKREAQIRSFFEEHFQGEEYAHKKEEAIKILLTSTTKLQVNNRLMKIYPNEVVSEMIKDLRPLIKDLPGN